MNVHPGFMNSFAGPVGGIEETIYKGNFGKAPGSGLTKVKVRNEFPESWIWTDVQR